MSVAMPGDLRAGKMFQFDDSLAQWGGRSGLMGSSDDKGRIILSPSRMGADGIASDHSAQSPARLSCLRYFLPAPIKSEPNPESLPRASCNHGQASPRPFKLTVVTIAVHRSVFEEPDVVTAAPWRTREVL
ncbi:hypothetical protein Bbelb_120150 [Branchiostoma belcheri]|nr:hypothetical protein Bbelb_120150 [Branchiostoma belcheri]